MARNRLVKKRQIAVNSLLLLVLMGMLAAPIASLGLGRVGNVTNKEVLSNQSERPYNKPTTGLKDTRLDNMEQVEETSQSSGETKN